MTSASITMAPSTVQKGVRRITRLINTKKTLKFGTWNIRTLVQDSRLEQVEKEMTKYGLDMLCFE